MDTVLEELEEQRNKSWWMEPLEINKTIIPFKIDTGANVNIIGKEEFNSLKERPALKESQVKLTAYAGSEVPVYRQFIADIRHKGETYKSLFIVSNVVVQPIIGIDMCEKLNLVKRVWTVIEDKEEKTRKPSEDKESEAILEEFKNVFAGFGTLPGEHTIRLKENAVPVVEACRKVSFALHDKLKEELDRMEKFGVISKVTDPTEWVNSLVIVHKANGKLRICLDPRNLNKQREHYKMPTRDEIHAKFSRATVFSKFDASQGFWQVKLDDESAKLCTFNSPFGRYQYRRLPFGISSDQKCFIESCMTYLRYQE